MVQVKYAVVFLKVQYLAHAVQSGFLKFYPRLHTILLQLLTRNKDIKG